MTESPPIDTDDVARMIMLTYGRLEDNSNSYWCYVAVRPSQYARFQQTQKQGKLNLQTFYEDGFGEVIVSGDGVFPPAEVTRKVAKLFDIPIKDLFGDVEDPQAVVSAKIAELRRKSGQGE